MRRRVVITGLGAVTPIGTGIGPYWEGLLTTRSGVGPLTLFDPSEYPVRIAAEVHDFDDSRFFDRKQARLLSRSTRFAVGAAVLALQDGRWQEAPGDAEGLGVVTGVSNSSQDAIEAEIDVLLAHGYRRVMPYVLTKSFPHSASTEIARLTGFQSQVLTISTACTAGLNAVGWAAQEIVAGRGEVFLCTATDATISKYVFAGFCRSGLLSTRHDDPTRVSRPFDAKRSGGVLGEGAGSVLLEEWSHAQRRGATVYAEVLGAGSSGQGYGPCPVQPARVVEGMATAMARALATANCGPAAIDYIGCHGVSDVELDVMETDAIKAAFGPHAYRVPLSSVKSMIGIPQSGAGMLQLVATAKAVRESVLPPTANYEYADPRCDLDCVPNRPRRNRIGRALVFAHGFNGSDAAVVLGSAANR